MSHQVFAYEIVTPPSGEIITLDRVKKHLRMTSSQEDDFIMSQIPVARIMCENQCGRHFLTTTVQMVLDCFPGSYSYYLPHPLPLMRAPAREVVSLEYIGSGEDDYTVMDPSLYTLVGGNLPCVALKDGIWPITNPKRVDAVRVTYKVGFGPDVEHIDPKYAHLFTLAQAAVAWVAAGLFEQRSYVSAERVYEFDVPTLNVLAQLDTGAVN